MSATIVSRPHNRLFALLAGGALLAVLPGAEPRKSESPLAGTGPMAAQGSAELQWPEPIYERPDVAPVEGVVPGQIDFRSAEQLSRSAASVVESQLPPGVSLRREGSHASFFNIGPSGTGTKANSSVDEDIDSEQAPELNEDIDEEQARELGRGRSSAAPTQKWIVHYPVDYQSIPVSHFADVVTFIGKNGKIDDLRKRNLPTSVNATSATVTPEAARKAAVADAGAWALSAAVSVPKTEIWVDPDASGKLAYRIEIASNDLANPNARRYWISAVDEPRVIFWENLIFHTHNGQVTGTIWPGSGLPNAPTTNMPMGALEVQRSSGGKVVTGANGLYAFPSGAGNATMTATLSGPNSKVDNVAGGEMVRTKAGTPNNPVDLAFNASGEEELAQTSGFFWTNQIHDFAKNILADTDLPALPTNVNIAAVCNAFWNHSIPYSINFFKSGSGCPNTAYNSVVAHEYGHGIDSRKGGIANFGYSEGFGDAMSILLLRKSCVGEDFFGAGTCLRDAKDLIMWPPGPGEGTHEQGRRYAGFVWELTQQLKKTYAEDGAFAIASSLVLAAAQANPTSIPDAVMLSFISDDDDGSLANGTPHFKELAAAADSRNLPRPADPTIGTREMGFAWANDPVSVSYTPSATYSHNSAGGPITATRSAIGRYAITFSGLGGNGTAGANVQITAYGTGKKSCKVVSWSLPDDFKANIRCFGLFGAPANSRYTILVTWP